MIKLATYLLNLFLPKMLQNLFGQFLDYLKIKKEVKDQKEKVDKVSDQLEKVVKNPEATEKEKKDAFKDYLDNLPR